MKLYYIDKPGCHAMPEIMKGVRVIYQMEQEFYPYLQIEFLPHRENIGPGIILKTKDATINRSYSFDTPNDIQDLRNLIWHYLRQDYGIKDITSNGYYTDFRDLGKNRVISGWNNVKNYNLKKNDDECCKIIPDNPSTPPSVKANILHEVFRLNLDGPHNRETCKAMHFQECTDNFPVRSNNFDICMNATNEMCNRRFPKKYSKLSQPNNGGIEHFVGPVESSSMSSLVSCSCILIIMYLLVSILAQI